MKLATSRVWALIASLSLLCATSALHASETLKPIRTVEGNVVTSTIDPAVTITVPKTARYAGADRWILFGVADCEIHVFFEADAQKKIKRIYWVQFEGYIPSKPNLRYQPKSSREETLGELPFFARPRFGSMAEAPRPDSDAARVFGMLQSLGYQLPAHMMNATFIHYFGDMRKELMIIVMEDMASIGRTSEQLLDGDKARPEWGEIGEAIIRDAKRSVSVMRVMKAEAAPQTAMGERVRAFDAAFFNAFNSCDLSTLEKLVAADLEFFHDLAGASRGREAFITSVKNNVCGKFTRTSLTKTFESWPLGSQGAIYSGSHQFCHVGKTGCQGEGRFLHVLEERNGQLVLLRVVSYDHRDLASPRAPAR